MQELLWLLLPVAAASGWWAARRSMRGGCPEGGPTTSPAYFRGLNYLLNEEPDKAIDVFVELLEVDSDTVETHLALGNLFRRRGEVERAIRIHQNLIARPALTRKQRAQALLELGQDYMRAGLYDRAENLFKELEEMKLYERRALKNLRVIYQQERDWEACLRVADALEPLLGKSLSLEKSHYYCELATKAIQQSDYSQAKDFLKKALAADGDCVRAIHLQADIAVSERDCKGAVKLLKRAIDRAPEYLPDILPALAECQKGLGDTAAFRGYLETLLKKYPYDGVAPVLADLIREGEGDAAAIEFLREDVERHPSLRGLLRLIELKSRLPDSQAADVLFRLREHLERLLAERPQYQCSQCGFVATTRHWQCPSCRSWNTIKRKPEIENKHQ